MLTIEKIENPFTRNKTISFFRSGDEALNHILDHLMTANECFFWMEILPELRLMVPDDTYDGRFHAARHIVRNPGDARPSYQAYRRAIDQAVRQACHLGWNVQTDTVQVFFNIDGVVVIIDFRHDTVLTAYLPGCGSATAVNDARRSDTERRSDPIPREPHESRQMPVNMVRSENRPTYRRSIRGNGARNSAWTRRRESMALEDYLYLCFTRAFGFVRNQYGSMSNRQPDTALRYNDLYELKKKLHNRRLNFDEWKSYFEQCMALKRGMP